METLLFENVKKFFLDNPDKIPQDASYLMCSEGDRESYELDPGYWFSEATELVKQNIICFPGWTWLEGNRGFQYRPIDILIWAHYVRSFTSLIATEYDYSEQPGNSITWEAYGLRGDDDVDYNGGYLDEGVLLIESYLEQR